MCLFSESVTEITVTNLENSQMLHIDESGSVTLPVYSTDQALTPVCICLLLLVSYIGSVCI